MEINEKRYGFAVKEIHELTQLCATLTVMEHEKTGAIDVVREEDALSALMVVLAIDAEKDSRN